MKKIQEVAELGGKKVLLRIDVDDAAVNPFPVRMLIPTLSLLKERGAKTILIGHVGRDPHTSGQTLFDIMRSITELSYVEDITGALTRDAVKDMREGDVLLLNNLRSDEREIENDAGFAKELASLADIYVNDAFAVSHRNHASIVGVPTYLPSFAGLQMQREVEELTRALEPKHPALFILSGAKLETKLPLIEKFIGLYDKLFVAGVLANSFFKAKGFEVGTSLAPDEHASLAELINNPKILLPTDVVVEKESVTSVRTSGSVQEGERIVDAGPQSIELLKEEVRRAHFIVWNGPLGEYEKGFAEHTRELAQFLAAQKGARTLIGGGDTLAAIAGLGLEESFSFTSTGGGAMLEFLLKGTLPGIEALN